MKWALTSALIFCPFWIFSQTLSTEYFDSTGEKCPRESSFVFAVGRKNSNGFFYDTLRSFYSRSGHLRSVELRDQYSNRMGLCESFYENGNLRAVTRHDRKFGKNANLLEDSIMYFILEFYDSLGHPLVKNGEGFVNGVLDLRTEQGKVVNGLRDSVWTMLYDNGKVYSYESWQAGRLIDGVSYDESGKEYYYKQLIVLPTPVSGMQEFYKLASKKIRYPKEAQRRGIQGRVLVEFVVEKDGSITSPNVLTGLGFGCDEEAVRALTSIATWIPSKLRGQSASYTMVIPIIFKLN